MGEILSYNQVTTGRFRAGVGVSVLGDIPSLSYEQPHTMTRSHSSSTVPMAEAPKVLWGESLTHLATTDGLCLPMLMLCTSRREDFICWSNIFSIYAKIGRETPWLHEKRFVTLETRGGRSLKPPHGRGFIVGTSPTSAAFSTEQTGHPEIVMGKKDTIMGGWKAIRPK